MQGVIEDRRDEENAQHTHRWLVVGTDSFMSGWGGAERGKSVAAWACETHTMAERVAEHVKSRSDMRRVRIVYDGRKGRRYKPENFAHFSVYVVTDDHRYAQPLED